MTDLRPDRARGSRMSFHSFASVFDTALSACLSSCSNDLELSFYERKGLKQRFRGFRDRDLIRLAIVGDRPLAQPRSKSY